MGKYVSTVITVFIVIVSVIIITIIIVIIISSSGKINKETKKHVETCIYK